MSITKLLLSRQFDVFGLMSIQCYLINSFGFEEKSLIQNRGRLTVKVRIALGHTHAATETKHHDIK